MSFIARNKTVGRVYAPGFFLADNEGCTRLTFEADASNAQVVTDGNAKAIVMGTIWPANGSTAQGIVYEDVDVSEGNMPGSLVTRGVVYKNRLPDTLDSDAQTALEAQGFVFIEEGDVTRPDYTTPVLKKITIESAAGTDVGDTALTVTYTPGEGESYKYKVGDAAEEVEYGDTIGAGWTSWDGDDEITAATGKILSLVSIDTDSKAVAFGSVTVVAKANG